MELAYSYKSKTARGRLVNGIIYAKNQSLAVGMLNKGGMPPFEIGLSLGASVKGLLKRGFSSRDLARFYFTMGRRIKKDKPIVEGLASAIDFIQDSRLRQAISMMRQAIQDGQPEGKAMEMAGFPSRDSKIVAASAAAGKVGDAFLSLAKEVTREAQLRKGMVSIFTMPVMLLVLMYAGLYAAITLAAPNTLQFLAQADVSVNRLSPFLQSYFAFATDFNANLLMYSTVFWSAPFFLVGAIYRSGIVPKLADRIRWVRELSVKTDAAMLWSSYALLYGANISPREICKMLHPTAVREDSRIAMKKMQRMLNSGLSQEDSVGKAGFQNFVVEAVRSSISSGDLTQGLREMCDSLEEDIAVINAILKDVMGLISLLGLGIGVGALFMVTYFPVVSAVLQNI